MKNIIEALNHTSPIRTTFYLIVFVILFAITATLIDNIIGRITRIFKRK